ncbi:MAG: PAS domain-containing protein [Gammaproteobacteria bacterium]|nr:PAS domain-containing protein [Gammaproteobacteria bacterium]
MTAPTHRTLKNWQFILALTSVFSLATLAAVWHVSQLQAQLIESTALKNARLLSDALTEFRTLYTSEVVRAAKQHGLEITHDYAIKENAIPLPATLSMLLGEKIGEHASGSKTTLYSPYPFPWRQQTGGLRDAFREEAWQFLGQNPDKPFYRFTERDGVKRLRYATADVMRPACVQCHNSHPQTPKNDWHAGDIRGVLEVDLPLDQVIAQTQADLKGTIAIFSAIALLSVVGIASVTSRLRRGAVDLQHRVEERTAELAEKAEMLEHSNRRIRQAEAASKAAQAELAESGARLQYLIDNNPAIIYSAVPTGDFKITFVSENLRHVLGYEPHEMLDDMNFWFEHIHPDDRLGLMQRLPQLLADGGQQNHDYRFRHRDGRYLWMHDRLRMVYDKSGTPLELLGSLLDISDRKAMEEALRIEKEALYQAQNQLLETNRLKSEFLANMSHELRTPLNAIIGFAGMLRKGIDGPLNDEQRKSVHFIENGGTQLLALINDVLDLSKIEAGHMELRLEPVVLALLFEEVTGSMAALFHDKGLTLQLEVEATLAPIRADATRLRQVMLNLLSNAVKFTDQGGVTVHCYQANTAMPDLPLVLRDHLDDERCWLVVAVQDSGIGIAEEDIHKVFEEFRQIDGSTTRKVGGTGLGMPISKRFVEMHGGSMWLESQPGQGTCVYFTLPMEDG